jgi:plasmid stability protein
MRVRGVGIGSFPFAVDRLSIPEVHFELAMEATLLHNGGMATLNIKNFPDKLHRRLKQLAERDARSVAQEVIHLLTLAVGEPRVASLLELRGLGREAWRGVDAARYVAEERKSWD